MQQECDTLSRKVHELEKEAQVLRKEATLLRTTLALKDKALAEKDALVERLASAPRITNLTYNVYNQFMTPWVIDPTHPGYARQLETDVRYVRGRMRDLLPLNADTLPGRKVTVRSRFKKAIADYLPSEPPRYLVTDMSRKKGYYITRENGEGQVDVAMLMVWEYVKNIAQRVSEDDTVHCNDWLRMEDKKAIQVRTMQRCLASSVLPPLMLQGV